MGPLYHELTKNKLGVTVVESFLNKLHIDDAGLFKGIVLTRVNNCQCAHPVVFATSCAELNVVSTVVVDTSLGQHGIVLNLRFPGKDRHKGKCEQQFIKKKIQHIRQVTGNSNKTNV